VSSQAASGLRMILDILTVLFLVLGWVLILMMFLERRRDVLHGPYVKQARNNPSDRREGMAARPLAKDLVPLRRVEGIKGLKSGRFTCSH
jgi:hypothetical protein